MYVILIILDIFKDIFFNKVKVVEDKIIREGILDSIFRIIFKFCWWN